MPHPFTDADRREAALRFLDAIAATELERPTISLQPGQPGQGLDYEPGLPLPYPIFVRADDACDNVPGYPMRGQEGERPHLLGFTATATPDPEGMVMHPDWLDRPDPTAIVGMHPVFACSGDMFTLTVPITNVAVV